MGFDDGCNTSLVLGLGFSSATIEKANDSSSPMITCIEPSLSLALPGQIYPQAAATKKSITIEFDHVNKGSQESQILLYHRQACSPNNSSVSNSFSSGGIRVKRERDLSSEDDHIEVDRVISSRVSDHEDEDAAGVNARKKLRLTKEQSALLEESFKQHSTLNPKQKQALARQLNLRPRQVEVWFQNRRARTKLKQTEVDCELLKKCCESLTDENRRLHKELQELKALNLVQPFYMHMPAATLTVCPSCVGGIGDGNSKGPFQLAPKPPCYSPFANPSAAC